MKIKKIEQLTDEKWINLYAATFVHRRKTGRWVYASRRSPDDKPTTPDAVLIVPILLTEGEPPRLVIQKEFRVPLGGYNYSFPAGLVEEGETVEEMVERELMEETGLDLIRIKRISPVLSSTAGLSDETVSMVFVDAKQGTGKQQLDASEDIEVMHLTFEEVCDLCDSPDLMLDAKAWCALYFYQQIGKLA